MIDVQDLRFTYPGNREEALNGLDFTIGKGEIFGFLGPSGAGKSTTQKILIGVLKQYSGRVQVLNQELRDVTQDYYEKIGVAFEFPNFYSKFTALENLNFFRSLYSGETEDPMRLLEMVGLEKDANTRVANFSKGMKMRLNFIRAFLNKPELIFLDEPTSGLDPVNGKIIKDFMLMKKAEGKTILLNTHNMNAAEELCDRVAFLIDGKIPLIDSPRQLMVEHGRHSVRVEYQGDGELQLARFEVEGIGYNEEFQRLLREREIVTMHTEEATLEDIFLQVTGRRLA
ncbi:ABC transporter ATP-binding protein [Tumebacillus sp. DT12]|uniref:ABC transporter ATP-binding protein n=1 Tax=Tumebacillus lacus TaxID=2995335 RepID=A0ABT3X5A2_9BACL|nr:ABC transporter ATP-binding protein [Tumebacillus lacus]MCX7570760.1 ABC transporter ATP-binding protein [Tumebacillus lacus]